MATVQVGTPRCGVTPASSGHVEALTLQLLFSDTTDEALSLWNRDHQPHPERLR